MTKRIPVPAMILAAILALAPQPAAAKGLDDVWDIIDSLSGPGPFTGGPVIAATVACWQDGVAILTYAMTEPGRLDPCLYVEFRDMFVEPKGPYGRVTAKIVETGVSFEQFPVLDVGAGIGAAFFATNVGGTDYNVRNLVITPMRVVVKPLRLWITNPRANALQVHFRTSVRLGDIDGSDFGAPASTFSSRAEVLRGFGVVIDVLQAFKGRRP